VRSTHYRPDSARRCQRWLRAVVTPPVALRVLFVSVALATASPTPAQDPLRGRDIYLNAALVKQQPGLRSCVQCHGLPPDRKLWGASPAQLRGAFASVTPMGRFATELQPVDVTDLSAFLADPTAVPLPLPRLSPLAPEFAALPATSSPELAFVLENGGSGPFTLGSEPLRVVGAASGSFRLDSASCTPGAQLAPGAACGFTLRYAPGSAAPAAEEAELRIEYASIARATTVTLRGKADALPAATLSATGLSFAPQAVGSTSAPQRIVLSNAGQAVLAVNAVTTSGSHAGEFIVDGSCGAAVQLAPGAQCAFEVRFAPQAVGTRTAQAEVTWNGGKVAVALSGAGGPAAVSPPVVEPPAPPAPAPAGTGGDGGGGGAVSPLWVALLLAIGVGRRLRRKHPA
jgi:hypothetical protein